MKQGWLTAIGCVLGLYAPARAEQLPPPPTIAQVNASSANIALGLTFWYEMFAKGNRCVLEERDVASKIQGLGSKISTHKDPAEQKLLIEYYNKHLLPAAKAWLVGVPGHGSYDELAARRAASLAWLSANRPAGPVNDAEQAKAYVAAYRAYQKRAADDHAYVMQLNQTSACHRKGSPPSGSAGAIPAINGFMSWQHETSPDAIERSLGSAREALVPAGLKGESEGTRLLAAAQGQLTTLRDHGKLLEDAYRVHYMLEAEKPTAERMTWFAPLYQGARATDLAEAPKRLGQMQDALAALIVKHVPQLKPSKAAGGAPGSTVKSVMKGKHIKASRATSELRKSDKEVTDTKDMGGGKVLVRKYRVVFTAFDAQYVTAANDLWKDLPGLPVAEVCALRGTVVRKYTKGLDRQLNKWLAEGDDVVAPILCKHATATGELP